MATGDERVAAAVRAALGSGPLDLPALAAALRARHPASLGRAEGLLHPFVHRELRRGTLRVDGRSERGLSRYALAGDAPTGGATARPDASESASVPGEVGRAPAAPGTSAALVAAGARGRADRFRIAEDVAAHLADLEAEARAPAFGRPRHVRHLLQRVDRGRPTVLFVASGADVARRFLIHEGPWLLAAVAAFFLIRGFVTEVFYIPSDSMVPTLLRQDRVLVWKPGGREMPDRWRIVTFVRGGVTYVKRVAGRGGEALALVGGDVFVDGALAAKPDDLREVLRFPYRRYDLAADPDGEWARLTRPDGSVLWRYAGETLWSAGALRSRTAGPDVELRDVYADLEVERGAGETVGLALGYLPPAGSGASRPDDPPVRWVLRADDREVRLEGEGVGSGGPRPPLVRGGAPPAGPLRLRLSHVDGTVRADAGGWSFEVPAAGVPVGLVVRPEVESSGPASRPRALLLDADLHYSRAGSNGVPSRDGDEDPLSYAFPIPPDQVFLLGDNTHDSKDSRFRSMGAVPVRDLIGPVYFRIWPPSRIGAVR